MARSSGPVGIHDDFLVNALLTDGIPLRSCHGSLRLKKLTDTREAQQFFCAHHWVVEPMLVFVRVIKFAHFEIRVHGIDVLMPVGLARKLLAVPDNDLWHSMVVAD
jgi:hypothetical protein